MYAPLHKQQTECFRNFQLEQQYQFPVPYGLGSAQRDPSIPIYGRPSVPRVLPS